MTQTILKHIEIHITLQCNLSCFYCGLRLLKGYKDMSSAAEALGVPIEKLGPPGLNLGSMKEKEYSRKVQLPYERLSRLVDEAHKMGVTRFTISGGGEPLCEIDRTLGLIKKMSVFGADVELVTNGTLLERETIEQLIDAKLMALSISVDSADTAVMDRRRGHGGVFRRIQDALLLIRQVKRERGSNRPSLRFYSVLDSESIDSVEDLGLFAEANDVEEIHFLHRKDIPRHDLRRLLLKKYESFPSLHTRNNLMELVGSLLLTSENGKIACVAPFDRMVVHVNGLVTPCCSMVWGSGDFIQQENLSDIWSGGFMARVRGFFLKGSVPECCSHCCEPVIIRHG